jgi:7-cyano-7-deazaguanine tRNA-ribosyltransferase
MSFSFEVKESDLLGRIGTLCVGKKRVETPYLFPVIHPVRQDVSVGELGAMGFGALMTNSLILYTRRREEALARGIHALLGFDGIFMTDSGGYQVLEYGEVDVTYQQIAAFQSAIGSELAVTLDRPTGDSVSRVYAKETVTYSLANALATHREFPSAGTVWVGPVQGGVFMDLVQGSANGLLKGGFKFLALGSPTQIMENYRFAELAKMIIATRRAMPYSVPLHLFGAGHPLTMALSVALGCDTFDSASYILFARQGRYMTSRGILRLEQMSYLPCSCPICSATTLRDMGEMTWSERTKRLSIHNLHLLKTELQTCKEAISEGRLWDLVEERAASHPRLLEAFRCMAEDRGLFQEATPRLKEKGLMFRSELDRSRPEIASASIMLAGAMKRHRKDAVIVVEEDALPIAKIVIARPRKALLRESDVYRVHPLLGPYPAELDFVYPFTQTVMAEMGNDESGTRIREARQTLRRMGYRRVGLLRAGMNVKRRRKGASRLPRNTRMRRAPCPSPQST